MATQRVKDKQKAEEYLKKLEITKTATSIDPFESADVQRVRIERAKRDIGFMVETYMKHYTTNSTGNVKSAPFHIEFANMVLADPCIKAFAQWGRGLAKSVWCDVFIVLWLWINDMAHYLVLVSDTKDRAADLLVDLQVEFEANALLIHDFGEQKLDGSWERGNFITQNGFIAKSFGVRQKVRGLRVQSRRPDICVIDDLETPETIKNPKRMEAQAKWIESDLIPTMIHKNRRMLYANNRFARVMTQTILQERHPKWTVQHIRAYNKATYEPAWKAMYTPEFYRQQEEDMTVEVAWAEYNHEAILKGKVFNEKQIQWCKLPPLNDFTMIVSHWDIAYAGNEKSDYNAIRVWGLLDSNFYLIDCYVKQSKMKPAVSWLCQFHKSLPSRVNISYQYESQFWNGEVQRTIDETEDEFRVDLNMIKRQTPTTNKLGRIMAKSGIYQNSRVYYNEKLKSHSDTQVGLMQLCAIEPGSTEHDDAPDADEQATTQLELYCVPRRNRTAGSKSYRTGKVKHKHRQI